MIVAKAVGIVHAAQRVQGVESRLQKYKKVKHKFAIYHVPLYPAHRSYDGGMSKKGREHWAPLFDTYALTTAFENHDHVLKRSKLLKNNKPDADGTLYLGDGCFGMGPRSVDKEMRWYLDVAESKPHFWDVKVTKKGVSYEAVGVNGETLDRYPVK